MSTVTGPAFFICSGIAFGPQLVEIFIVTRKHSLNKIRNKTVGTS